ncbi:MAG: hydroxyisourate hydrolase [Acidobacteria bacterium]|nr:hydroxyisourate hydrolase [Acidobacteriota bacterium]
MPAITTHILDVSGGAPASGVTVALDHRAADGSWASVAEACTDANGRATLLQSEHPMAAGDYRLRFDTGAYFGRKGLEAFFPEVVVSFRIAASGGHHHVPLLLSPYGYSTYRGSK